MTDREEIIEQLAEIGQDAVQSHTALEVLGYRNFILEDLTPPLPPHEVVWTHPTLRIRLADAGQGAHLILLGPEDQARAKRVTKMPVTPFDEWFVSETVRRGRPESKGATPETRFGEKSYIQHWVIVSYGSDWVGDRPHYSFDVAPTPQTIAAISKSMIQVDYDRIYFELVCFADYSVLYARYNQILGSRKLALIENGTVPKENS